MIETQGLAVARAQISVLQDLAALAGLSDQDADARVERACRRRRLLCGRCGGRRRYALSRGRYRCARCRYTFLLTTGRWLARLRVPSRKWLLLIKCFELGLNGKAAAFAGVSAPTFYRAYETIRLSLADRDMRWKPGVDGWAARGRGALDVLGGRGNFDERGRPFFDFILDSLARHVRPPRRRRDLGFREEIPGTTAGRQKPPVSEQELGPQHKVNLHSGPRASPGGERRYAARGQ